MPIVHPTGGLVYHARAARMAHRRWADFRQEIGDWLAGWETRSTKLLLIAPSAGYSLPSSWLHQFEEVVVVDFDPVAKILFRSRHRECKLAGWISEDVFPIGKKGIDWRPLRRILHQHPDHAVLFSNVLGQIGIRSPNEGLVERDLARLPEILQGCCWASYHDRLSAPQRPVLPVAKAHLDDDALARFAYPLGGEISSYSTENLGLGQACQTFAWECRPGYWHLIEGLRSS